MADDSSILNVDGANTAARNTGIDTSPPKTPMERIPKKDNVEKKRLTAAEKKELTEQKRKEKEDKKRKEKPESSTDKEWNEALKKILSIIRIRLRQRKAKLMKQRKRKKNKKRCIKTNLRKERMKLQC